MRRKQVFGKVFAAGVSALALSISSMGVWQPAVQAEETEAVSEAAEDAQSGAFVPAAPIGTEVGAGIRDFKFTTYDGRELSLYETLQEKKMVLINCWASWCGPCQAEFPFMEEAYEKYKDDVEVFAMSCEEEDSDEVLADYVAEMGMTFPVGRDEAKIYNDYSTGYIPLSIVVDRYGVVCLAEVSSQSSSAAFERLFDVFCAEEYPESVILDGFPPAVPDEEPVDPAKLAEVLGGEGLTYVNPEDEYNWPFVIEEDHVASTNQEENSTASSLDVKLTAAEGDVFALDYKESTEMGFDFLRIYVNGEQVKFSSGERDWTTWGYQFAEAGDYTVTLSYEKDEASSEGEDTVWLKNLRLLTGEDATALMESLPVYPMAEETMLSISSENAREVVINDPASWITGAFGEYRAYIVSGETAEFTAALAEGLDAESAVFNNSFDGVAKVLSDCVEDDHYVYTVNGLNSYATTGSGYTQVALIPSADTADETILLFAGEADLNTFLIRNSREDTGVISTTWKYADGSAPETVNVITEVEALAEGEALYQLVFVDENGNPVEGAIANVCDDSSCSPMTSDANGMISFAKPAFAYHIQVIKVPEGYEYDTTQESYLDEKGGVTTFTLGTK